MFHRPLDLSILMLLSNQGPVPNLSTTHKKNLSHSFLLMRQETHMSV